MSTFKSAFSRWHWTTSLSDKIIYVEISAERYHDDPECAVLKEATGGHPSVVITSVQPPSFLRPCTICVPTVDSGNT